MTDIPITEARDARFSAIDRLDTLTLIALINDEDALVHLAVRRALPAIARVADAAAAGISRGGRLIYIGAGTSGRLGVLDAAECPPTFGVPPETVQGHIAGGTEALTRSVEGAEDDAQAGAALVGRLRVNALDTIVGISASGGARFVIAAVARARRNGAFTAALTSNEHTKLAAAAEVEIALVTGPEVIAGSTRMKCGTAQKMALNMLSTAAMVRLGHAKGGVMTDMKAVNEKLRARSVRIVSQVTGAAEGRARAALEACGYDTARAIRALEGEK
ncbi:MAG TPA: N-acetylmuramic acid 6-phosphate etherase [Clostridia bacterium]|nr:N-acetylmuramic acid 6-phosphate etherase [Clostridia bacterium]